MRKSPLILVAFLLCLYIVPAFFMSSYDHAAIPAQQNIGKDFVTSASWNEVTSAELEFDTPGWYNVTSAEINVQTPEPPSSQSITSFSETTSDDVLHYPDLWNDNDVFASSGTVAYQNTYVIDGTEAGFHAVHADYMDFETVGMLERNITYRIYLTYISTAIVDIRFWNWTSSSFDEIDTNIGTSAGWYNGTFSGSEYVSDNYTVRFSVYAGIGSDVTLDYMSIDLEVMTGSGYAESFTDVSDWENYVAAPPDAFSSDGDVLTIESTADGANDYEAIFSNNPSTAIGNYLEIRYKSETLTIDYISVRVYAEDDHSGDMTEYKPTVSTSWLTYKIILTQVCESIMLGLRHDTDGTPDNDLNFDYVRISPADEMGFQHDGSTVEGFTVYGGGVAISDGDNVNLTGTDASYGRLNFLEINIRKAAYPFLKIKWKAPIGQDMRLLLIDEDDVNNGYLYLSAETGQWITDGISINAILDGDYLKDLYIYDQRNTLQNFEIDYIKLYSIANYTVTQGASTTTTDFLFVDDGSLNVICPTAANHYFTLDYDPIMAVDTSIFELFNITATVNTQWFAEYVGGWQSWKVDQLTGVLESGTMTDFKLLLDGSTIISSISFLDPLSFWWDINFAEITIRVKDWADVVSAILHFLVEEYIFDWFFIFLGLIMIPVSTLFLVRGGKEDMSKDKLFLFFIIFLFGWAFFLGGIM